MPHTKDRRVKYLVTDVVDTLADDRHYDDVNDDVAVDALQFTDSKH